MLCSGVLIDLLASWLECVASLINSAESGALISICNIVLRVCSVPQCAMIDFLRYFSALFWSTLNGHNSAKSQDFSIKFVAK